MWGALSLLRELRTKCPESESREKGGEEEGPGGKKYWVLRESGDSLFKLSESSS